MISEIDKLKHFHVENYSGTTFFNHQHEMTRSSSVNKTTMKNILNDGRDISIAKLVENTSLIIK